MNGEKIRIRKSKNCALTAQLSFISVQTNKSILVVKVASYLFGYTTLHYDGT